MTKNSKKDPKTTSQTKFDHGDGVYIENDDLMLIIDRLQWILEPEIFYTPSPKKAAEEALIRCRLRARDLLSQIIILLPDNHPSKEELDEVLHSSRTLATLAGISRESPGERSIIGYRPRQTEILGRLKKYIDEYES